MANKCFLCVVGGTGSRVGNAFMQTIFAGVDMPTDGEMHILSIDADLGSNDTQDLNKAVQNYIDLHDIIQNDARFANVTITFEQWQPNPAKKVDKATLFHLTGNHSDARDLLDILYDEKQQNINVNDEKDGGFRANPNVGACFLREYLLAQGNDNETGYGRFKTKLRGACNIQGDVVRLLMVGSLFGGTGASSFVCIASDLCDLGMKETPNFTCGAVMMTPYFAVRDKQNQDMDIMNGFYTSTKEALTYYHNHWDDLPFHAIYLFGAPVLHQVEFMTENQRNPASLVEAEAAQACVDFFTKKNKQEFQDAVFYKRKRFSVSSDFGLPSKIILDEQGFGLSETSMNRLLTALRFCINYLYVIGPMVDEYTAMASEHKRGIPDYYTKAFQPALEENTNLGDTLWIVCYRYLNWFLEIINDNTVEQSLIQAELLGDLQGAVSANRSDTKEYGPYNQRRKVFWEKNNIYENVISHDRIKHVNADRLLDSMDVPLGRTEGTGLKLAKVLSAAFGLIKQKAVRRTDGRMVQSSSSISVWPLLGVNTKSALGDTGIGTATVGYEQLANGMRTVVANIGSIGSANNASSTDTGSLPEMFQPDFRMREALKPLLEPMTVDWTLEKLAQESYNVLLQCLSLRLLIDAGLALPRDMSIEEIRNIPTSYTRVLASQLGQKKASGIRLYSGNKTVLGYTILELDGTPRHLPGMEALTACPAANLYQPYGSPAESGRAKAYAPEKLMLPADLDLELPQDGRDHYSYFDSLCQELETLCGNMQSLAGNAQGNNRYQHALQALLSKMLRVKNQADNLKQIAQEEHRTIVRVRDEERRVRGIRAMVYEWLSLPKAIRVDGAADFSNCVYRNTPYIVPLTRGFFEELKHSEESSAWKMRAMLQSITFTERDNGKVLINCVYDGVDCSKEFPAETKICRPAMVWPPAPCDVWHEYYLYCEMENVVLNPSSVLLAAPEKAYSSRRYPGNGINTCGQVARLSEFPEIFEALDHNGDLCGHVVISRPPSLGNGLLTGAIVGLDFGSTNSTAYYCTSGKDPVSIKPSEGVYTIYNTMMPDEVRTLLDFHTNKEEIPDVFMTLINDHRMDQSLAHSGLETSSIPFTKSLNPDLTDERFKRIKQGLKFNDIGILPQDIQQNCEAFLKQFVTEIRWTLLKVNVDIKSAKFYYAVPSSMSREARDNIHLTLANILDPFDPEFTEDYKRSMYEAEAVGAFATKKIFAAAGHEPSGYACVDIGGGSIDISLWQAPTVGGVCAMIGETSINRIAGHGLLKWLMRCTDKKHINSDLLEMMKMCFVKEFKHKEAGEDGGISKDMEKYLDNMYSAAKAEDVGQFSTYYGARAEQLNTLYRRTALQAETRTTVNAHSKCTRGIELYFCLIMYFVGEMVGAAITNKKMKTWEDIDSKKFTLCLAGNGSKFISLAGSRSFTEKMNACFDQGVRKRYSGKFGKVDIRVGGEYHKHEVAGGLCYQFGGKEIVELHDGEPPEPTGFEGDTLNFDLEDFKKAFGAIQEGGDDGNTLSICTDTSKSFGNYGQRFREMVLTVLTKCDLA